MNAEIDEYLEAEAILKKAEGQLNKVVSPKVKAAVETKDIDALMELVDELPKSYHGVRRIYEAVLRIQERPLITHPH